MNTEQKLKENLPEHGEPFCWCIESNDSADWCFAKTKEGVESNAVLMDSDGGITDPFPLFRQSQPVPDVAEVDPLQGAVDWLITAHSRLTVAYVQRTFIIGYNRAQRLYEAALAKHGGVR